MELPVHTRILPSLHRAIRGSSCQPESHLAPNHQKLQRRPAFHLSSPSRHCRVRRLQLKPAEPRPQPQPGFQRQPPPHSQSLSQRWPPDFRQSLLSLSLLVLLRKRTLRCLRKRSLRHFLDFHLTDGYSVLSYPWEYPCSLGRVSCQHSRYWCNVGFSP